MKYITLLSVFFISGCSHSSDRGTILVKNLDGGMNDSIDYVLINEPKGNADDTVWEFRTRSYEFELNEGAVKQTVELDWHLAHNGIEFMSFDLHVDSAGYKFSLPLGKEMLSRTTDDLSPRIITDENGATIKVHSRSVNIDYQLSSVQLYLDSAMKFIMIHKVVENAPHGIMYDRKMMVK